MMAGILFQFGTNAFKAAGSMPLLTFGMVAAYLLLKRFVPRYCMVLVLLVGIGLAVGIGGADLSGVKLSLATPQFIAPEFTWAPPQLCAAADPGEPDRPVPAGHGDPARVPGYPTPARPILAATSVASVVVAFFGSITIVIAAITAALYTGRTPTKIRRSALRGGHRQRGVLPDRRLLRRHHRVAVPLLPKEFVAVLAGLALIGAITANLLGAINQEDHREASVITTFSPPPRG